MISLLNYKEMKNCKSIESQHTDYLHKWLDHLNFNMFTDAMYFFLWGS